MKPLNPDIVPANLDQAINTIIEALDSSEISGFRSGKLDAVSVHHTLGQLIRNSWSLWERDTTLSLWFRNNLKIGHADDISGVIILSMIARLKNESFFPQLLIEEYHEHWRQFGCDMYGDPIS